MTKSVPFKKLCVATVCASVLTVAYAQTLDEVVVSVSGQEQSAFDAPAAVQAVDQTVIQNSGPQVNLSESLNRIPGLIVLNRQNYSQDLQLSIRGSGSRASFGIRGSRLIVDGIPATMPDGQGQASTISLPSAKRIEVLRGPLAQMYGNSSSGVIQVFSVEGTETPQLKTSIDVGPNDLQRLGLQATGTLNGVGYVIDHSDFKTDGYRRHSAATRKHTNTKLTTTVFEDTKLSVVGNFFDMPLSQDPRGLRILQLETDPRQAGADAITFNTGKEVTQNQMGVITETQLSATSDVMLRVYLGERTLGNRLAPTTPPGTPNRVGNRVEFDRTFQGFGLRHNATHEWGDGALTLSFGVEVEDMKDERKGFLNLEGGVKGRLTREEDNIVTSTGVFAQANWLMNEDWSAVLGLRSNEVQFKVKDDFINLTNDPATNNPDDSGRVTFRSTNPVVGLTRHLSEDANLFFNYGKGFDTPTLTEIAYKSTQTNEGGLNLAIKPATSDHFEIGLKSRLGETQRLDVSYFLINTKNEIVVSENAGGRAVFTNATTTQRNGLEVAHSARWSKEISSYLAFTTLNARFKDSFESTSGTIPAGNYIPGTMDKQLFAELVWQPIAAPGFSTSLEWVHQGKIRVNDLNVAATKSASVFNVRLGWNRQYGPWGIKSYLRVENIADKDYVGSVIANDGGSRFYEPAPGRQVGVGLSANYSF